MRENFNRWFGGIGTEQDARSGPSSRNSEKLAESQYADYYYMDTDRAIISPQAHQLKRAHLRQKYRDSPDVPVRPYLQQANR